VRFSFAPEGGRATGHKPAWWTRIGAAQRRS
jgi:hypothetical protein